MTEIVYGPMTELEQNIFDTKAQIYALACHSELMYDSGSQEILESKVTDLQYRLGVLTISKAVQEHHRQS